jgi:microcystin-dependent protein
MTDPFVGEIKMVGFDIAPHGWAFADGQTLSTNQNTMLFAILGNTYGGDGIRTFALPELRGRTPIHRGRWRDRNFTLGEKSGTESVTLTAAEIPAHTHEVRAVSTPGDERSPQGALFGAEVEPDLPYSWPGADSITSLRSGTVADSDGGQQHENMQPYLTVNFLIALAGIFPNRN